MDLRVSLPSKIEPKPDLRIVRLVVSIAKETSLSEYYFELTSMRLACEYCGIDFHPANHYVEVMSYQTRYDITRDSLIWFLQKLHGEDQNKFAKFISYTLGDIFDPGQARYASERNREFRFLINNLRELGYQFEVKNPEGVVVTPVLPTPVEETITALDGKLKTINPNLVEIRKGAWSALHSESPDRYRQSIASSRELLNQTINALTDGKTRKEKVSKILGDSDAETVEAVCQLVGSLYSIQSKGTHGRDPNAEDALFVLNTTQLTLYFLLNNLQLQNTPFDTVKA